MNFKIKLPSLRPRIYNKTFIFDNDEYFNTETGEKSNRVLASRGHVIQMSSSNISNFIIKEKKAHMRYIYQTKDKKSYAMSSSLTTNYIEFILSDKYKTNMFVLRFPNFIILFFGKGTQKLIATGGKEDIEDILESTFQGLQYVDLEFSTVFGFLNNSSILIPITLILVSLLFLYFAYSTTQEDEIGNHTKTSLKLQKKQQHEDNKVITNSMLVESINTNLFLEQILDAKLPNGAFIGSVDFGALRVAVYSFSAMPKSSLVEHFFKKNISYQKKALFYKVPFKPKTTSECLLTLGKRIDITRLRSIDDNYINFVISSPKATTDETYKLLKGLYRCPIIISNGSVQYIDLRTRQIQISLTLFKNKKKD